MSNEHPDMSGFPDLSIYTCDRCGREIKENKLYGSDVDDTLNFCSDECVSDYEILELSDRIGEE